MRAGQLRDRVTIQQSTIAIESDRSRTATWSTFAERWARVEDLAGDERFSAQQVKAEVTAQIRLRYLSGLTPLMRVVHGSDTYQIEAVIDVGGAGKEHLLLCSRVDS